MHILNNELLNYTDQKYKVFTQKLVPDTKYPILGIRVPCIKQIIKKFQNKEILYSFLSLNHTYYEEWFLHGLIIGQEKKDIDRAIKLIDEFLPHLDNWAICDSTVLTLKIFKKYPVKVLEKIKNYLNSELTYVKRFGIVSLLGYFMDDYFNEEILSILKSVSSDNYYVNMAIAWALSVAIIKHPDITIKLLESKILTRFIQNKTIQKAIESFRVPLNTKEYLKTLKI